MQFRGGFRGPVGTIGAYEDVADATADHQAVKLLHTEAGLIDACDAAEMEKDAGSD